MGRFFPDERFLNRRSGGARGDSVKSGQARREARGDSVFFFFGAFGAGGF